jgi:hypothetical protein
LLHLSKCCAVCAYYLVFLVPLPDWSIRHTIGADRWTIPNLHGLLISLGMSYFLPHSLLGLFGCLSQLWSGAAVGHLGAFAFDIGSPQSSSHYGHTVNRQSSLLKFNVISPVFVKEKKIEANGTSSRRVATMPKL